MAILSWGSNSHGQLGQNIESEQTLLPTKLNIDIQPKQIIGGGKHTIIITTDGEIFSCGDNDKGQLGFDLTVKNLNALIRLPSFQIKIEKISCGWDFNLALSENQELFGWGSNSFGQLGLSTKTKIVTSPVKVNDFKVVDVACGLRHSAVVRSDGLVFTSGAGRKGQLGFLKEKEGVKLSDSFKEVPIISKARFVTCGENHCLVLTENQDFFTWGDNKYGQLGINPTENPVVFNPTKLEIFKTSSITQIFSGWTHNVILTNDGKLINFGRNDYGQLGEKRSQNWQPDFLKSIRKIKQCSVGSHHTYILTEDDEIFSWGWNEHGNCGNGDMTNIFQPVKIDLKNFKPFLIGTGAAHSFVAAK